MIKEIQGLRAIAILMVLFVHSVALLPLNYHETIFRIQKTFFTSTGVELFFVLAGYFLMYSLDKYKKTTEYRMQNLIEFIVYKFRRLAGNIYFWSFIAFIFAICSMNNQIFYNIDIEFKKYISTVMFLRNFTETSNISWFGIYWAVSLEFQVFIVVSIFYFLFKRKYLLYISCFFCVLMFFYRFGGVNTYLFRFDVILYGVILYEITRHLDKKEIKNVFDQKSFFKLIISIIMILCLSSSLKTFSEYPNFSISISAMLAAIMIFIALTDNGYFYINTPLLSIGWRVGLILYFVAIYFVGFL